MTYIPANIDNPDPVYVSTLSSRSAGPFFHAHRIAVPASAIYPSTNRILYVPFFVSNPYTLAKWWWLNGATVGTNYIQAGIYDESLNLLRASPKTLSAGTVNSVQLVSPGIHGTNVTSGGDITDGTVYTTASVTLKAGVLYLMAVENSKASAADVVSSIDSATGGYPTFVSRSSTTYNTSTANRVSIWSAVPTSDFTATLRINFGATQTGAVWSLNAFYHVDTATNDGIVQNAVGTGTSVTPLATLAAFGSANNATFGAFGQAANATGAPSVGYFELSDSGIATPVQALQTDYRPDNDTTVDETITSAAWGACAVEIKSLGTGAVVIPPMRGYLAIWANGTTATLYRATAQPLEAVNYIQASAATGFKPAATLAASTVPTHIIFGFTSRSSP
jgi:hypothetical protein